jgi:hypothetical protein
MSETATSTRSQALTEAVEEARARYADARPVTRGYYMAALGYMALSLALDPDQLAGFTRAVGDALETRSGLWAVK